MSIRNTTLYVIIGAAYLFVVRFIATIVPEINSSLAFFKANSLVSLLASLTPVAFFTVFRRDFVREEQVGLHRATLWVLIGSAAVAFLFLKGPVIAFQLLILPGLFRSTFLETIGPGLTWASSVLMLVFFIVLYRELRPAGPARLYRATGIATAGAALSALMRTVLLLSYLVSGDLRWVSDLPRGVQWGLLPVETLAFLATLYFFLTLYRLQAVPPSEEPIPSESGTA
ncbi:MAG: hypothetical protein JSU77_10130 [Fidelibacterota bacterium]|nr:MAG: hypothetical protein JSU77_10130 [Candidatus Neomarinimicrobiota bacterium]